MNQEIGGRGQTKAKRDKALHSKTTEKSPFRMILFTCRPLPITRLSNIVNCQFKSAYIL